MAHYQSITWIASSSRTFQQHTSMPNSSPFFPRLYFETFSSEFDSVVSEHLESFSPKFQSFRQSPRSHRRQYHHRTPVGWGLFHCIFRMWLNSDSDFYRIKTNNFQFILPNVDFIVPRWYSKLSLNESIWNPDKRFKQISWILFPENSENIMWKYC